jgi:hypothetical protein
MAVYLAWAITGIYAINVAQLLMWGKVARLAVAALAGIPLLIVSGYFLGNSGAVVVLSALLYLVVYIFVVKHMKVEEADLVMAKIVGNRLSRFKGSL